MRRLTINQVAKANITVNRKAYTSLFLGILTAVFLATATSLCAWGTVRGHEEQMAERVGWMDMFVLGNDGATDEQLRRTGYFTELGHVTVNATVEGSTVCAGWYDEAAAGLMNRRLTEGRMPEKAGEAAMERSALIRLGLDKAKAGDTLTLNMQPCSGISEERTFLLTGILNEQTDNLETYLSDGEGMRFPAMLVTPEETYTVGGTVVHRVLAYAPLITFNQFQRHFPEYSGHAFGVSRENGQVVYNDSGWARAANILGRILIWAVLGAALMLSSCVGITSAMESLLGRKTEDIGMMRAIGATSRQIRRIYGAEAWLLTATALPAGLAAGIAAAWAVSRLFPGQVIFSLNPWLTVPILGLSALCVFTASRLPLYHASRRMPMGVLRDTGLLRRAGKLKSRRDFRPARLIAGRRTRLHPMRQLGAACMIALTLLSTLMLGELAMGMRLAEDGSLPAFRLYGSGIEMSNDAFTQTIPEDMLSRAELNTLNSVEGVRGARSVTSMTVNLLLEEVPEYFRTYRFETKEPDGMTSFHTFGVMEGIWGTGSDWVFWTPEDLADARARMDEDWTAEQNVQVYEQMAAVRELLGLTGTPVPVSVYVADLDVRELQEYVTDGAIDTDRLDSGEQVLVYAPTLGVKKEQNTCYSNFFLTPGEAREDAWDLIIRNDAFTAGMPLSLLEITAESARNLLPYDLEGQKPDWKSYYRSKETFRAETAVGAVLTGPVRLNETYMYSFSVILSPKGAEALGLKLPNPEYTSIYLSGDPTPEEEEAITEQISQTALRGRLNVENRLQLSREYKARKTRQILLFAALILLFFAVSVFMQVTGTARQIRSEIRTIGTLRAVGADLKALVGCYSLPVWFCAAAALAVSLLIYAVTWIPGLRLFTDYHPQIMIPALFLMAACVALACIAGIRARLAGVSRQSITENIREL